MRLPEEGELLDHDYSGRKEVVIQALVHLAKCVPAICESVKALLSGRKEWWRDEFGLISVERAECRVWVYMTDCIMQNKNDAFSEARRAIIRNL